jgi:hypothetical protein
VASDIAPPQKALLEVTYCVSVENEVPAGYQSNGNFVSLSLFQIGSSQDRFEWAAAYQRTA